MVTNDKMTVMQVRPNYSIVYQFKPTIKLERANIKSQKNFIRFVKDTSQNWKDGDYFFKCPQGTFAYFTIAGSKVKVAKKSKITGKEYLCWQFFKDI